MNVFKSKLIAFKTTALCSCLTICQFMLSLAVSASILTACGPGNTTNNYGVGQTGMSGGGQTRDPGDGSGGSTGDGGGGQGVQCGNAKNPDLKNKLFVRDIYEARFNHQLKLKEIKKDFAGSSEVSDEALKVLTDSLASFLGPSKRTIEFANEHFWKEFIKNISFIDNDKKLYPSKDANSPIALPQECKIVQIAFWDESAGSTEVGTLYVNKDMWVNLDQTNKIGLLAHEYFFKLARRAQYKNSDATRVRVGQLLSIDGLSPIFTKWVSSKDTQMDGLLPLKRKGFKFCQGTSDEDSKAKLQLYQYQDSEGIQRLAIPLIESSSINFNPLVGANFAFKSEAETDEKIFTDLLLFQTSYKWEDDTSGFKIGNPHLTNIWLNPEETLNIRWWWESDTFTQLKNMLAKMSNKREVIWTEFISQQSPIKVEFINPAFNSKLQSKKSLKSRDDLVRAIHLKIDDTIKGCVKNRTVTGTARSAITILDNEISFAQASDTFPKSFVRWKGVIQKIIAHYSEGNQEYCAFLDAPLYKKQLPDLLYRVTQNTFTAEEAESALDDDAYYGDNADLTRLGQIRTTQANRVINFDITCEDYTAVFGNIRHEKTNTERKELSPSKSVLVKEKIEFKPIKDDGAYGFFNDIYLKHQKKRLANLESEIQYLKFLGNFLEFNTPEYKDTFEKFYSEQPLKCKSKKLTSLASCRQLEHFVSDLKIERSLVIEPCDFVFNETYEDGSAVKRTCALVTMTTLNNRYMIYVGNGYFWKDSETPNMRPSIEYVRQIPY